MRAVRTNSEVFILSRNGQESWGWWSWQILKWPAQKNNMQTKNLHLEIFFFSKHTLNWLKKKLWAHPVKMQVSLFTVSPEWHRFWWVKGCDGLPKVEHPDTAPHCSYSTQHPHHHPRQQTTEPGGWETNMQQGPWFQYQHSDLTVVHYTLENRQSRPAHQSPVCDLETRQVF